MLREVRSLRIVPLDPDAMSLSVNNFDAVVWEIEGAVLGEMGGRLLGKCWTPTPARELYSV
jgi:hypothetical protein